jgi:hypothetical protein
MNLQVHAVGQERRQRELDAALGLNAHQQEINSLLENINRLANEPRPETGSLMSRLYRNNQRSGWYYVDTDE